MSGLDLRNSRETGEERVFIPFNRVAVFIPKDFGILSFALVPCRGRRS